MKSPTRLPLSFLIILGSSALQAATIDYNRQIRPILSDNCYSCHGPDKAQRKGGSKESGGLRLDVREVAIADLGGYAAIVPGDAAKSALVSRIFSTDPDEVMPPTGHLKTLTAEEKGLLRDWINDGAEWADHWAFIPPEKSPPPVVNDDEWPSNPIDYFILRKLEEMGLEPSPEAAPHTLARRANFDILGLPTDPEQVAGFVSNPTPEAYERHIDSLLESSHYGERMTAYWLDLVRYADSVGYHGDQYVSISPYRDYVINAFNDNMPFDQFTREQLGGDLLPEPTLWQQIASGYNRLGMMSAEGGVQPKEYLAKYASDRVRNASTVWMGMTLGCAECHDHKFDPFSAKDFYSFAAFFADITEKGLYPGGHDTGKWGPSIDVPSDGYEEKIMPVRQKLEALEKEIAKATPEITEEPIKAILAVATNKRSKEQKEKLAAHYKKITPELESKRGEREALRKQRDSIHRDYTRSTLITVAREPRTMRVLHRGDWMDTTGEEVQPAAPHFMSPLTKEGRANRLDLADWFVQRDNPLTARVFVNRLWKLYFGTGLSKVLDDLGAQGEWPEHAELLDWLAVEFMESGWDVKHMVRLIVTSSAYKQSSKPSADLRKRDPYNRLLARQSRFRLDAEMVRDNALGVAQLLNPEIGGDSVKPYQPEGLYRHLNFPARKYQMHQDDRIYRRGLYVHWQRQFLHPAMKTFDAPAREECTAERPRSNTPLAALVLLNDPSYVEAARSFAEQGLSVIRDSDEKRMRWMIEQALLRPANAKEINVLSGLLEKQRAFYQSNSQEADAAISIGKKPVTGNTEPAELAAWISLARAVYNLHEFITRY